MMYREFHSWNFKKKIKDLKKINKEITEEWLAFEEKVDGKEIQKDGNTYVLNHNQIENMRKCPTIGCSGKGNLNTKYKNHSR